LMEFMNLLELMIYGGLVTGLVLMYLSSLNLSPLDYTLLLSMVKKDVVKELWMLDITLMVVITHLKIISQPLLKMILTQSPMISSPLFTLNIWLLLNNLVLVKPLPIILEMLLKLLKMVLLDIVKTLVHLSLMKTLLNVLVVLILTLVGNSLSLSITPLLTK